MFSLAEVVHGGAKTVVQVGGLEAFPCSESGSLVCVCTQKHVELAACNEAQDKTGCFFFMQKSNFCFYLPTRA